MQSKKELMAKVEELQAQLGEAHEEIESLREPDVDSYFDDDEIDPL